jgi:hypothetical protein
MINISVKSNKISTNGTQKGSYLSLPPLLSSPSSFPAWAFSRPFHSILNNVQFVRE